MNPRKSVFAVLAYIVLLSASTPAGAVTTVGGLISSNTDWGLAGSPYVATSSIAVVGGATLGIEPGVEVRFDPNTALVVSAGTLSARGTEAAPIRFTANQGAANRWGYVQFSDNAVDATYDGSGNYLSGSILEHVIVEYAGSTDARGAVRAIASSPFVHNSTIRQNAKGGIYVYGDNRMPVRLVGNTIAGNTVSDQGGGVYITRSGSSVLTDNTILNNRGSSSGGVHIQWSDSSVLTDNIVRGNVATVYDAGGVFLADSKDYLFRRNIVSDNQAARDGGGLRIYASDFTLEENRIAGNRAGQTGGGIRISFPGGSRSSSFVDNTITENTAGDQGGAVWADSSGLATFSGFSGDRITRG